MCRSLSGHMAQGWGYSILAPLCHKTSAERTFCGDVGLQPARDINFTDDMQRVKSIKNFRT